ncbi:enoyl-CoA hydratase/isomerase family protein [Dactylosporangium sp. CA-233914]|uniref:enoyl-CoA hydratase/isomerase family protein n=1 Tax=Dactylosporangium sp. CA-233914 TaxID=3239934 RepID=UPI003D8B790B
MVADTGLDASVPLLCHVEESGVAHVVLNRPARRNALDADLASRLGSALESLDDAPAVGAVVLSGAAPGFCAGSDMKNLAGMTPADMARHEARMAAVARTIALLQTPVIAAVEGFAVGGGFLLATSCDVVVSASDVRWHLPEVTLGWVPPWGLQALTVRVGPVVARRLAWGAHPIDGAAAREIGVADDLTEPGQAVTHALEQARALASLPRNSVTSTKRAFASLAGQSAETLDAQTAAAFERDCHSPNARSTFSQLFRDSGASS